MSGFCKFLRSNAALFGRAAAIVGNGGDVPDDADFQANGLNGAHGGFATGAGTFDADFDFLQAVAHGLAAGILGNHLRGVGGALAGAFEAALAGARPSDGRAVHVGDGDDRVVERGDDMRNPGVNVLAALGLDDLDLLDDRIRIEREILFLPWLGRGGSGGIFLLSMSLALAAFGAASGAAAASGRQRPRRCFGSGRGGGGSAAAGAGVSGGRRLRGSGRVVLESGIYVFGS